MQNRRDGPPDMLEEIKQNVGFARFVLDIHAMPFVALLRKPGTVGERYFGFSAMLSTPYLMLWAALGTAPGPMLLILLVYLVALAGHKQATARALARGERLHSWCMGASRLGGGHKKGLGQREPALCLLLTWWASMSSPTLAAFLGLGAVALITEYGQVEARYRAERRDVRDAMIEQERVAEYFHE